ncbi:hypothetical protein BJX70DRAFT_361155 [Aspergillus crustosus]
MADPAKQSLFHHIDDDTPHLNLNFTPQSRTINPSSTYNMLPSHSPPSDSHDNDNDVDIYDYNDYDEAYDYENIITNTPATTITAEPGIRVRTTTFTRGEETTVYHPESGAYDQTVDYRTGSGGSRHHRERMTADGVFQVRDVENRGDGSKHVHKEYENTGTGTRNVSDFQQ